MSWGNWRTKATNTKNELAAALASPDLLAAISLGLSIVQTPPSATSPPPNIQPPSPPNHPSSEAGDVDSCSSSAYLTAYQGSENGFPLLPVVREDREPLSHLGLNVPPPIGATTTDSNLHTSNSPGPENDALLVVGSLTVTPWPAGSESTLRLSPRSLTITDGRSLDAPEISKFQLGEEELLFQGAYSDVYRAQWKGQAVAVKILRRLWVSDEAMDRKCRRELQCWWGLDHPSILPLLAFAPDFEPLGAMISPFYENRDALTYLANAKPGYLERINLWLHVIEGISYLHGYTPVVIHGDLKPANIVIDDNLHARICDFGLSRILLECDHTGFTTTTAYTGTTRYKSRELFSDPGATPTSASDVYSLGCLALELIFGGREDAKPYAKAYSQYKRGRAIEDAILTGQPPVKRPKDLDGETAGFWDKLQACWDLFAEGRPTAVVLGEYVMDHRDALARELEDGASDNWGGDDGDDDGDGFGTDDCEP